MIGVEPAREILLTKAAHVKVLPSLSRIIEKVFSVLNDSNSSFEQIEEAIRYDPSICSKVLSIANSAYFCRGLKILNLQRAMVVIGFEEMKNILTCLVFHDEILRKTGLRQDHLQSLWCHSLDVACCARTLSARTLVEDPEKTFTAALLHDVGKIVLHIHCEGYEGMCRDSRESGKDLCEEERKVFGTDHQELGFRMAAKWRFPEEFGRVIGNHHDNQGGGPWEMLLRMVNIADRFVACPDESLGMEGLLLLQERDAIESEISRIMEVLGLSDEKD